jgi:hypothetical protein
MMKQMFFIMMAMGVVKIQAMDEQDLESGMTSNHVMVHSDTLYYPQLPNNHPMYYQPPQMEQFAPIPNGHEQPVPVIEIVHVPAREVRRHLYQAGFAFFIMGMLCGMKIVEHSCQ